MHEKNSTNTEMFSSDSSDRKLTSTRLRVREAGETTAAGETRRKERI